METAVKTLYFSRFDHSPIRLMKIRKSPASSLSWYYVVFCLLLNEYQVKMEVDLIKGYLIDFKIAGRKEE